MDILIFVIALSVLVLVHEFGHFLAAKLSGVKVEEFGLGLPPRIIGKKKWGTIWSLNWLPIGGFCKLYGEDSSEKKVKKSKESFLTKNPWQKMLIVLGGVLMNVVFAVLIFSISYTVTGIPEESGRVKILEVVADSPAEKAGLKKDQVIKKFANIELAKGEDLTTKVGEHKGEKIELMIEEGIGRDRLVEVEIRESAPEGQGLMGVVVSSVEIKKIKWFEFYKGIGAGFKEAIYWGKLIAGGLGQMITGLFRGEVPKDVAGPLGMYKATSAIRSGQGIWAVIHFFGIISVNLAIVNILPFPALDGGRIIFVLYELIARKRANEKFEIMVNNIGMVILLALILLVTIGDVRKLVIGN